MPAIIRPRNTDGTFGQPVKIGKGETDAEKVVRLESEKELLLASMMELSVFAAIQQETLNEQNSAIMELSMLVAAQMGGGS